MRILMLTQNCAGSGGSFMRSWSLGLALGERGHDVTLLAGRRRPGLTPRHATDGHIVLWESADLFPRRVRHGGLSPLDVLGRLALMRREHYDIVYGFELRPAVSLPALCRRAGLYVSDWADLWGRGGWSDVRRSPFGCLLRGLDDWSERRLRRHAAGVTAISRFLAVRAEQMGIPGPRIRIIGVGANSRLIRPLPMADMRRRFGLAGDIPVLVSIGFASHDTGFLLASLAAAAHREPRLLLVCSGGNRREFEGLAAAAGISDHVRHLGVVPYDELSSVLACGNVMLLPMSRCLINEARLPNRFGDFLAAGKPLAITNVGDLAEVVVREDIGVRSPPDPAAFAAAVLELLGQPGVHPEMGSRARRLAETAFSWAARAEELEAFFRELADR